MDSVSEISNLLIFGFKEYQQIQGSKTTAALNKLTFIDKKEFKTYVNGELVHDHEKYKTAQLIQQNLLTTILYKIDLNPRLTLRAIFTHNQLLFFKIQVNGLPLNTLHRGMTVNYIFEYPLLRNEKYKTELEVVFKEVLLRHLRMEHSFVRLQNNIYSKIVEVDDANLKDVFELKVKFIRRLQFDLLLIFLFYRNKIIRKEAVDKFIDDYLKRFRKLHKTNPVMHLPVENLRIWATGIRFLEVIADNFKYDRKYILKLKTYQPIIDELCPSLRYM